MTDDSQTVRQGGWHLDKKVPISIIVLVLVQAALGLMWLADMRKDIEILKAAEKVQANRDDRQDQAMVSALQSMAARFDRLEIKIDRLADGQRK